MEKKTWEVPELQEIDVRLTLGGYSNSGSEKTDYAGWDVYDDWQLGIYMNASVS